VEATIAVAVLPPWTAAAASAAALALLIVFTAAVVRLLRRGKRPACSCFGALSTAPIGAATVWRNTVLMVVAGCAMCGSIIDGAVPEDLSLDRSLGAAALAAVAARLAWVGGEVAALRQRVDQQALSTLGAEGLPVGAVAPIFELTSADGARVASESLLDGGRSALLVFVHPACEMCAALARELPRWHARTAGVLSIAVVGNGDIEEHAAWGRAQGLADLPILVQQGNETALRYRVRGTPSGVLVGPDGRVAAPVARGAMAIRELIVSSKTIATEYRHDDAGKNTLTDNSFRHVG
jgi:hypothetical protein